MNVSVVSSVLVFSGLKGFVCTFARSVSQVRDLMVEVGMINDSESHQLLAKMHKHSGFPTATVTLRLLERKNDINSHS